MEETITALCYINDHLINEKDDIEYNQRSKKVIRIKKGMKLEELENKICRVFHIDRTIEKILIIYRYPQVILPAFVKCEPVPLTDDEDMEIMFSTISSHSCISGVELYIDIQTIEALELVYEQDDYEVAV